MANRILSVRASSHTTHLLAEGMSRAAHNPYDPKTNPNGILNMGVAENTLMESELSDKINSMGLHLSGKQLRYGSFYGSLEFRKAIIDLLNRKLKPKRPLNPDHITAHNGCGSTIDSLVWCIADAGDGILIPSPYYGGFDLDLTTRSNVTPIPIPSHSPDWSITTSTLESTYRSALDTGKVKSIRALIVCNPNNPLGRVYSKDEIISFLKFAKKYDLHVIMDEIYALSVWGDQNFESILAYDQNEVDWDKTHFVWGFSKDFCSNGLRVGCLVTYNTLLHHQIKNLAYFSCVSSITDHVLTRLLRDSQWIDNFLATNLKRMKDSYHVVTAFLDKLSISYEPCNAGFFLWIDLRKWLPPKEMYEGYLKAESAKNLGGGKKPPTTAELYLFNKLIDGGVYLTVGTAFDCVEEGWFRWNYASSEDILRLAMSRVEHCLSEIEAKIETWKENGQINL